MQPRKKIVKKSIVSKAAGGEAECLVDIAHADQIAEAQAPAVGDIVLLITPVVAAGAAIVQ